MSVVMQRRVLCVVMDGIGVRKSNFGNAVTTAKTPNLDWLKSNSLYSTLKAHGHYVGLPSDNDIGNSEVGHNALGSGKVFDQGAKLVGNAIANRSIFAGSTWVEMMQHLKKTQGTLHLMGLLSDGNVHSHQDHLHALMGEAKAQGIARCRLHLLLDGRDVSEKSAEIYIALLEKEMASLNSDSFDIKVASGGGRMQITMDRYEADWSMVEKGYAVHVHGKGPQFACIGDAISQARTDPEITDQYIPEFVIAENGEPVGKIKTGDAVVFFNFRGDRSIEISNAFTKKKFDAFDRGEAPDVYYAGMMQYDGDLHIPPKYLVEPPLIEGTLSEHILSFKKIQFACSETQKFGHVTFFWNGNRSGYLDKKYEIYSEIASDHVRFDTAPAMKAVEIADKTIEQMKLGAFDFGRINFANGDMVGHTGNFDAAVLAVEIVDLQIGRLIEAAKLTDTILIVTADHGNADQMFEGNEADYPDWQHLSRDKLPAPKTSHTLSEVPLYIYDPLKKPYTIEPKIEGVLSNIANTSLELMGLPQNEAFLPSLIRRG